MHSQSTFNFGSIKCKKCGSTCRNPLEYKNHLRNVHQELGHVKSSKGSFELPPKWRIKRVGAIDLFLSPSGELFEKVEQVLAEEESRNSLKKKTALLDIISTNVKRNVGEKETESSYTTLRSGNWYDGIEFRCDLCKKASFHYDFIYKQRNCPGFDRERAAQSCRDTLYKCQICFKEIIHTRKHIKGHLNNHNIGLEEYRIKYVTNKALVSKETGRDVKKHVTPEEIVDKFSLIKAKLENIKQQKKSLIEAKEDSIVDVELRRRWCDGYTFNCDMCSKDFYSFKGTLVHMTKSHPFAKEELERENSELFDDPTKNEAILYECKICHNKHIKHDERYIEEHTTSFHKMSLRQYESLYETNDHENINKRLIEQENVRQGSNDIKKPNEEENGNISPLNHENASPKSNFGVNILKPKDNIDKVPMERDHQSLNGVTDYFSTLEPKEKHKNKSKISAEKSEPSSSNKIEDPMQNQEMTKPLEKVQLSLNDIVNNINFMAPKIIKKNKETISLKNKAIIPLEGAPTNSNGIVDSPNLEESASVAIKRSRALEDAKLSSNKSVNTTDIMEHKGNEKNEVPLENVIDIVTNDKIEERDNKKTKIIGSLKEDQLNLNGIVNNINMELEDNDKHGGTLAQVGTIELFNHVEEFRGKEPEKITPTRTLGGAELSSDCIVNKNLPPINMNLQSEEPKENYRNLEEEIKIKTKSPFDKNIDSVQEDTIDEFENDGKLKGNLVAEEPGSVSIDAIIKESSDHPKIEEPKENEKETHIVHQASLEVNVNMTESKENERKIPFEEDHPSTVNSVDPKQNEKMNKKRPLQQDKPDSNDIPKNLEPNLKKAKTLKTKTTETDMSNSPMDSHQLLEDVMQNPSPHQETPEPLSDKIDEEEIAEDCSSNPNSTKSQSDQMFRPLTGRYNWNTPCPPSSSSGGRSMKKMGRVEEAKLSCPINNCLFITTEEHVQSGRAGLHLLFTHEVLQEDNAKDLLAKFTKL